MNCWNLLTWQKLSSLKDKVLRYKILDMRKKNRFAGE